MSDPGKRDPRVVLYVMDTLGLSGRTKGIIDLALHLDPRCYRPVFCVLGSESSALADRLYERAIHVDYLGIRPGLRPETVWKLGAIMRQHRVSVVHAVNPRPMLYAGLAARLLGVRGRVASLSAFACQVPDREYAFLPQALVNRGRRQAVRNQLACGLMHHIVAVSEVLGDRFCHFSAEAGRPVRLLDYHALRRKMHAISYGIDLATFQVITDRQVAALRARIGCAPESVLLGSIGRLVEQKDYRTQLHAFALAARQEPRLRMVLAGEGPLRAIIKAQASELGISDRIVLLGHWERVPELLRALDVYVLASKFEPYGVALLEAKCAGATIVATAVNEIPTLLQDGTTGLIVPPESPEPMSRAFLRLAGDEVLRRALGTNALAEARRRHSIEAVASQYQALYDDMHS